MTQLTPPRSSAPLPRARHRFVLGAGLASVLLLVGCGPTLGAGLGPGSGLPSDLFSAPEVARPGSVVTTTRAFGPGADIPSTFTGTGGLAEERPTTTVASASNAMFERVEGTAPRGVLVAEGGL